MTYEYDNTNYDPPAPTLPVTVRVPGNRIAHITVYGLVDTGADITCLPSAFITNLGALSGSSRCISCITGERIPNVPSYFLEFEIANTIKLVEVVAVGDELILGRNLINEFILHLHGPNQKLDITLDTE
jgi:predicted aspartyl protease